MSEEQTFQVPKCPKCGQAHEYLLSVRWSAFMYGDKTKNEPKRITNIRRLFTCPVTDEEFLVTITLTESAYNQLDSVEVTGVRSKARRSPGA